MRHSTMLRSVGIAGALVGLAWLGRPVRIQAQTQPPASPAPITQPAPVAPAPGTAPAPVTTVPGIVTTPGWTFITDPNQAAVTGSTTFVPNGTTFTAPAFFLPGTGTGFDAFFGNPFALGITSPFGVTNVAPNANTVLGPPTPALPTRSNLPLLGINTPAHTAGGGPVPYVHTKAAIVAPPVSPDEAVHPLGESQR